jgi:hypothetical protein
MQKEKEINSVRKRKKRKRLSSEEIKKVKKGI